MKSVIWMGSSKEDLRAFPDEARREVGYQLEHVQEGVEPRQLEAHACPGSRGTRDSRSGIVRSFPLHLPGDAAGGTICLALLPEKDPEEQSARFGLGAKAV
jgi:hypothetical protein